MEVQKKQQDEISQDIYLKKITNLNLTLIKHSVNLVLFTIS